MDKRISDVDGLSESQAEDFMGNPIWQRIVRFAEEKLEGDGLLIELAPIDDIWGPDENGKILMQRAGVKRLQGMLQGIRFMLAQPQSILDELKEERNNG